MKNKQIIELLGPDWEKFSEIILKYHKEINKGLDRQSILTQVIYLDKVINDFKFIFLHFYNVGNHFTLISIYFIFG